MTDAATAALQERLRTEGGAARVVSAERAHDLGARIAAQRAQGLFDEEFYQERLGWFDFEPPAAPVAARSIVVAAVPSPQTRVTFHHDGRALPLIMPPTYAGYTQTTTRTRELVANALAPFGYHVAPALLPCKLLAACSGLAAYGRNNITYVPGLGSFHQLVACYSDLPCAADAWQHPQMLARCERCEACRRACPTAAIPPDRFLLRAERCIVFHDERPREFPEWIDPAWHTTLIGCLRCQTICPENKAVRDWVVDGEEFSAEETSLLTQATQAADLPAETAAKLQRLDLLDSLPSLARNLRLATG